MNPALNKHIADMIESAVLHLVLRLKIASKFLRGSRSGRAGLVAQASACAVFRAAEN